MAGPGSHVYIAVATYVALVVAFVCTLLLSCACVPTTDGKPSILQSIYAILIRVPKEDVKYIKVGNFALCAENINGNIACASSQGVSASSMIARLSGSQNASASVSPVDVALELQRKVFFGIPAASTFFIFCTITCYITSHFTAANMKTKLKLTAVFLAGLSTAIMLVDGFSTELVSAALHFTNDNVGFVYESGSSYMALQWTAFAYGLIATGLLLLPCVMAMGTAAP